ncbi:hypothetical protein [Aurantimonas sp. 22II-16-19i]|uniref:hypothetical protein n=1 Tax=Aurantimonas sp. 22II-16-19i TaxID=1317114 RepID=UPI0009F7B4E1|nr:hypothetical protein [Aurantimonas sp. 22II-16-19i]ORE90995.1 hypothetical protein ATO4_20074 [Aurantimonas sp. 22II-16-19i]
MKAAKTLYTSLGRITPGVVIPDGLPQDEVAKIVGLDGILPEPSKPVERKGRSAAAPQPGA